MDHPLFSSYEKIPNSLKKLNLSLQEYKELDKYNWVVTEKIHGANFSFVFENGTLKYAKRKEYLTWKDDFFGFQTLINKIEDNILRLFEDLSINIKANKYMIYGELFGGEYPHPDVDPVKKVKAIQTGVYYCPSIEFCAFDIAYHINNEGTKYYLDYEKAVSFFEKHRIFYAKPLFVGKMANAMNFNIRINSFVPKAFGFPELEHNLIEGIVVKTYNQIASKNLKTRPILKIKNPEFDENDKFHEANKWTYIPDVSSKSEELNFLLEEIRSYINTNRLNSVISKIGALDPEDSKRMKTISDEFLNDVITDFNEDYDHVLDELKTDQINWIAERIRFGISELLNSIN